MRGGEERRLGVLEGTECRKVSPVAIARPRTWLNQEKSTLVRQVTSTIPILGDTKNFGGQWSSDCDFIRM